MESYGEAVSKHILFIDDIAILLDITVLLWLIFYSNMLFILLKSKNNFLFLVKALFEPKRVI